MTRIRDELVNSESSASASSATPAWGSDRTWWAGFVNKWAGRLGVVQCLGVLEVCKAIRLLRFCRLAVVHRIHSLSLPLVTGVSVNLSCRQVRVAHELLAVAVAAGEVGGERPAE